ncbi:glycosyltransferase, MGT family [Geodermatophilus dictyosporus]|uniref:Glycosyltransferase, MGT family n=1 Tax=Geodermatophilus dictyosporus TaxID=1523247 RepID=A0A1I5T6R1_9ACTN|nr:glycosyltransferase [Geodermatophilus dictyosporus]SFP78658.1 glycosyltransferase, MGT family [Geodermatophilus dictyosporus]
MADRRPGRYLMAVIDGGGTLPPALGLARELVRRGHTVDVVADPTAEGSARAAGCGFRPWQRAPHLDTVADQTALIAELETGGPLHQLAVARDRLLVGPAAAYADDVVAAVADRSPDAVLAEGAVPGILVGAIASGLPTAALMPNVYLRPTRGLPLPLSGWLPGTGPLGRARDVLAPAALRLATRRMARGLGAALAAHGQPPVPDLFALLDRCAEVLVMTSPSFDFRSPHVPANVHHVGPQLDDPDWAAGDDWRPPGNDPLVLVATSSVFQDQVDVLRRVSAALGQLPVRGLVTTGRAVSPDDVPAPPNVRVVRAAPHRAVLAEAAAVVTHAGHGTVLKTLAAGVPLVCLPMGRDQRANTVRVLRLGAGVRESPAAPPERIAAAVRLLLEDPSCAEAARRFAGTLAEEARTRPSAADRAEGLLPG